MKAIKETDFSFPGQRSKYSGKVRDVYNIDQTFLVIVATDRISAFDCVLPRAIPYKGQVLNQTSAHFFQATLEIAPAHILAVPDPNVSIGLYCKPYPIEMIVRGYLAGHAWREYKSGKREICGVPLPDGLKENDKLPEPIITPTTKSKIGHDEDISEEEIIKSGMIEADDYGQMKYYALELYRKGSEMARERGLILADTKYEMGHFDGKTYVIDEIHTPDSSRYFYLKGYEERQQAGEPQKQLSKEFVRKWLMEHGFQGKEGQQMPQMDDAFVNQISERYIELYENVTGRAFEKANQDDVETRIMDNVLPVLEQLRS
jgi:phosphoribosylaminoimidazole-succinocarboxamide synthase